VEIIRDLYEQDEIVIPKGKRTKKFFKKFYHKRPHRIGEGDNTNQPIADTA